MRTTHQTRAFGPGLPHVVLLFVCCIAAAAEAHDAGLSALDVTVARSHVDVVLSLATEDAGTAIAHDAVQIWSDGIPLEGALLHANTDAATGARVVWRFDGAPGRTLTITSRVPGRVARGHRELVAVRTDEGAVVAERLIDAASNTVSVALSQAPGSGEAALRFFSLGIHHIATGYDHLFFLAAMLLSVRRAAEAAAIVTAFSAAHALTLVLASLGFVSVPSDVVEPLVAASVMWVGLENVFRREVARRWQPAFAFGLVHGLAFAGALSELDRAHGDESLAFRLACFNAGIEAGQLAFAALVLPLLWQARRWPHVALRMQMAGSIAVVLTGGYWLLERLAPAFV